MRERARQMNRFETGGEVGPERQEEVRMKGG